MISATLFLTVLIQGPAAQDSWVEREFDPAHPQAVVVSGTVELSRAEADGEALRLAEMELRGRLERRATEYVERQRPIWLPGFVGDQVRDRWIGGLRLDEATHVLDKWVAERDHGFGSSYQTHLLVEHDEKTIERSMRTLRRRLANGVEMFLGKCGGTVVLWGLCALIYLWVDRLTKGYMTWRLRALFLSIGTALPAIAFLFA